MNDATAKVAAELRQQGSALRQCKQFTDAERSLLRALEVQHDFAAAHFELGLTYRDQENFEDAADYFQLAVHFAPDMATAWFELGGALAKLERMDAAQEAYREGLARDSRDGAAWLGLGNVHKSAGDLSAAIACYRSAVTCDPASPDAQCRLGYALYKAGHYAESRQCFDAALAVRPGMVEARHNLSLLLLDTGQADEALSGFQQVLTANPAIIESRACVAHALRDLGRLDEAVAYYDEVLAADPQFADAVINRSYALLMKGDYAAGWAEYERRFESDALGARNFPYAPWRGEALAGKRILVYAEQGMGDEIMFASCLPELLQRAPQCVIECNTRLAALFRRSFPGAHVHGGDKSDDKSWLDRLPPVDYQVAIGSLPRYFRGARAAFPEHRGYLANDPQRVEYWHRQLAAGSALRVGIAWRGGTLHSRQFTRSTALTQWLPLLRGAGVAFYALQYGDIAGELDELRVQSGINVAHLGGAVDDIDELAAIIGALDLVISIDNTVAHVAGALGKSVWTLLPSSPEWRYPRQGDVMPWYPSMRLYHCVRGGGWGRVFAQVAQDLAGLSRERSGEKSGSSNE
jgi:tetratricopeptide (TPR) repeat protein